MRSFTPRQSPSHSNSASSRDRNNSTARTILTIDMDAHNRSQEVSNSDFTSNRYNDIIRRFRDEDNDNQDDEDSHSTSSAEEEASHHSRWADFQSRKISHVDQTINLMDVEANSYSKDNYEQESRSRKNTSSPPERQIVRTFSNPETKPDSNRLFKTLLLVVLVSGIFSATYATAYSGLFDGRSKTETIYSPLMIEPPTPTSSPTTISTQSPTFPLTLSPTLENMVADSSTLLTFPPSLSVLNLTSVLHKYANQIDTSAPHAEKAIHWIELDTQQAFHSSEATIFQRYCLAALFFATHPTLTPENPFPPDAEVASEQQNKHRFLLLTAAPTSKVPWMTSTSTVCDWTGIECDSSFGDNDTSDEHRPILIIDLSKSNLQGFLPPEFAQLLNQETSLVQIDLSNNHLSGTLPDLPLLNGTDHLLEFFFLQNNNFSGSVPASYMAFPNLYHVDFSSNRFTNLPLHQPLSHLRKLYWNDNHCTSGRLPEALFASTNLDDLRLANNVFSGTIPPQIDQLSRLTLLSFGNNRFTGTLPSIRWNVMQNLKHLDIHQNKLSGTIHQSIAMLPMLEELLCNQNQFIGTIPSSSNNWDMPKLQSLLLSENQLSGTIPTGIGKLTHLKDLWLNDNKLEGSIPQEIAQLIWLRKISLNNNQLKGPFSSDLIQPLHQLDSLQICNNQLTGTVSAEICEMKHLYRLKVLSMDCQSKIKCQCCDDCH